MSSKVTAGNINPNYKELSAQLVKCERDIQANSKAICQKSTLDEAQLESLTKMRAEAIKVSETVRAKIAAFADSDYAAKALDTECDVISLSQYLVQLLPDVKNKDRVQLFFTLERLKNKVFEHYKLFRYIHNAFLFEIAPENRVKFLRQLRNVYNIERNLDPEMWSEKFYFYFNEPDNGFVRGKSTEDWDEFLSDLGSNFNYAKCNSIVANEILVAIEGYQAKHSNDDFDFSDFKNKFVDIFMGFMGKNFSKEEAFDASDISDLFDKVSDDKGPDTRVARFQAHKAKFNEELDKIDNGQSNDAESVFNAMNDCESALRVEKGEDLSEEMLKAQAEIRAMHDRLGSVFRKRDKEIAENTPNYIKLFEGLNRDVETALSVLTVVVLTAQEQKEGPLGCFEDDLRDDIFGVRNKQTKKIEKTGQLSKLKTLIAEAKKQISAMQKKSLISFRAIADAKAIQKNWDQALSNLNEQTTSLDPEAAAAAADDDVDDGLDEDGMPPDPTKGKGSAFDRWTASAFEPVEDQMIIATLDSIEGVVTGIKKQKINRFFEFLQEIGFYEALKAEAEDFHKAKGVGAEKVMQMGDQKVKPLLLKLNQVKELLVKLNAEVKEAARSHLASLAAVDPKTKRFIDKKRGLEALLKSFDLQSLLVDDISTKKHQKLNEFWERVKAIETTKDMDADRKKETLLKLNAEILDFVAFVRTSLNVLDPQTKDSQTKKTDLIKALDSFDLVTLLQNESGAILESWRLAREFGQTNPLENAKTISILTFITSLLPQLNSIFAGDSAKLRELKDWNIAIQGCIAHAQGGAQTAEMVKQGPLPGIRNGAANCWANSLFLLFFRFYKDKILAQAERNRATRPRNTTKIDEITRQIEVQRKIISENEKSSKSQKSPTRTPEVDAQIATQREIIELHAEGAEYLDDYAQIVKAAEKEIARLESMGGDDSAEKVKAAQGAIARLEEALQKARVEADLEAEGFGELPESLRTYERELSQNISSIDIQTLRLWFKKVTGLVDKSRWHHEDPTPAFEYVLDLLSEHFPLKQVRNRGQKVEVIHRKDTYLMRLQLIDEERRRLTFAQALGRQFDCIADDKTQIRQQLLRLPEHLNIQTNRFVQEIEEVTEVSNDPHPGSIMTKNDEAFAKLSASAKVRAFKAETTHPASLKPLPKVNFYKDQDPFEVPLSFTIPKEKTIEGAEGSDTEYELTAIIEHRGGVGGGHYVFYYKDNGKWYLIDDTPMDVREISAAELERARSIGYLYNFTKKSEIHPASRISEAEAEKMREHAEKGSFNPETMHPASILDKKKA